MNFLGVYRTNYLSFAHVEGGMIIGLQLPYGAVKVIKADPGIAQAIAQVIIIQVAATAVGYGPAFFGLDEADRFRPRAVIIVLDAVNVIGFTRAAGYPAQLLPACCICSGLKLRCAKLRLVGELSNRCNFVLLSSLATVTYRITFFSTG